MRKNEFKKIVTNLTFAWAYDDGLTGVGHFAAVPACRSFEREWEGREVKQNQKKPNKIEISTNQKRYIFLD